MDAKTMPSHKLRTSPKGRSQTKESISHEWTDRECLILTAVFIGFWALLFLLTPGVAL